MVARYIFTLLMLTMTVIGICTQGSAAQDFTNELVCYSGSRYLYIDPAKKSLQKCTDEELKAFGKATGNSDCLFYIYKDLQ